MSRGVSKKAVSSQLSNRGGDDRVHISRLRRARLRARLHARVRPRSRAVITEQDKRHAVLHIGASGRGDPDRPMGMFLLNRGLMNKIEAAASKKGSPLTNTEFVHIALADGDSAVQQDFSPEAINAAVASYYASPVAFSEESGIANMYAVNITLNYVIGALLAANSGHKETVRVKELASGTRLDHWQFIIEGMRHQGAKHIQAVLTDFVPHELDPRLEVYSDLGVTTEVYNVMDELAPLPRSERFNAFFASYTFDSIWQPEDLRLTRVGDEWYVSAYRLKVADWNKRKDELLVALRERRALKGAKIHDYQGIFVEEVRRKMRLADHPYRDIIYSYQGSAANLPGGAIKRIINAFDTQLHSDGVFVIGEVTHIDPEFPQRHSEIAGLAARYKVEDYTLLKQILETHHDMRVELVSFPELAERFLPDGWRLQVPEIERDQMNGNYGNGLIVISRGGNRI